MHRVWHRWAERPIFGKIRFMNYNGCKRKFDVARYVAEWAPAPAAKKGKAGPDTGVPTPKSKKARV